MSQILHPIGVYTGASSTNLLIRVSHFQCHNDRRSTRAHSSYRRSIRACEGHCKVSQRSQTAHLLCHTGIVILFFVSSSLY